MRHLRYAGDEAILGCSLGQASVQEEIDPRRYAGTLGDSLLIAAQGLPPRTADFWKAAAGVPAEPTVSPELFLLASAGSRTVVAYTALFVRRVKTMVRTKR